MEERGTTFSLGNRTLNIRIENPYWTWVPPGAPGEETPLASELVLTCGYFPL